MTYHVTLDGETYEAARKSFAWDVPQDFDAAHDLVGKHEDPEAPALHQAYPDGRRETYTFADLDRRSDKVAAGLADLGVGEGDRVGVVLPQVPANPLTHLACWKLGAMSVPLSVLFGPDGLAYRLEDADARVVVVAEDVLSAVDEAREECPALETVVGVETGGDDRADRPFSSLREHSGEYACAETGPDTPAIVLYTSGSTGPPKGVVHGHALWVGHCPAFRMYFERDLSESVCWTPADWAWIGALGDLLFPAWHYGRPVVGYPMAGFDTGTAYSLMEEFGVTDAFLPPTAIRMLMEVEDPTEQYDLSLKAICSGGEPLTPEILEWAAESLYGVVVNELYGQTEANLLVTNCREWFPAQAGSMGKPVLGHDVAVVDPETGAVKPTGEVGEIAVRRGDDPVVFQEYLNEPEKTAAARVESADGDGDWHLTGDLGRRDEDDYLWFKTRDDDLIVTSGYRVGPGEVESAILEHPKVEQVGVVGVPDEVRGEVIKAVVQPVAGVEGSDAHREEIQQIVRDRLAKHEYPRIVEFRDQLPQTTTGKIKRRELR
jgi:acetyl-CoA synthetase